MTDNELINKLNSIVGQSISEICYAPTKFYYSNPNNSQGNWTNVNPDLFVLHSPEWKMKLSSGQIIYFSAEQISEENFQSKFVINELTKKQEEDIELTIPIKFNWIEILDKPIKKFRLWQRVNSSSFFFGKEFNLKYQDHFQIIELFCGDKILGLTVLNGDIGSMTFYPTGCLGDRVGIFIDKTICSSLTVYDLTTKMGVTYSS